MGTEGQIRLVATNRAVYVLTGEQLYAFEAGTLRPTGAAMVPGGQHGMGTTGGLGTGTGSGFGTGTGSGTGTGRSSTSGGAGTDSTSGTTGGQR